MRTILALALLLPPLLASEETLALRFPDGATVYVEAKGLAPRIEQALASPFGTAVRNHPAVAAFWGSPDGLKARAALLAVEGATGLDAMGALRAVASRDVAFAVYGKAFVAMARVDAAAAERLLTGVELLSGKTRQVLVPADAAGPALWQLGNAYALLDGDLLAVSSDQLLATSVRSRSAKGLASGAEFRAARALVDADALVFATVDLRPFRPALEVGRRPKDLGQALLAGAFPHYAPDAPWIAVGLDVRLDGRGGSIAAHAAVPAPEQPSEAVASAYGGTLGDLPFALPARMIAISRLRRDLGSLWTHRDALIAEAGLPGLVEFETNFGNLTGGMSWVEEFLPLLGDEMIFLATRREYAAGEAAPAVRYPQGAMLVPLGGDEDLRTKLKVAYFSTVGIVNIQQGQMKGRPLVPGVEQYKGVEMHVSRYMAPTESERGAGTLPVHYNFAPSMAMLDGYLVLASTDGILKEIIDGRGGSTPAPPGINAGLWIRPGELRTILAENREPLVAQRMLAEGEDRAKAEAAVDFALELARYLHSFSFTVEETRGSLAVAFEASFGAE